MVPATDSHGEVWTEFYAKQEIYSGFDHVLVSPGLRGAVRNDRATIFDAPEVSQASDHRPVVVTLDFP
jgi:endonuclease/exonuclease/phosphatase family metal-dependent hydrolase